MKKRDLTKGSITKNLLFMSVPTMMGFFAQTLYDVVDMMWIGRISFEAVAGVTIFVTIFWVVEVLNEIIGSSSISLISQSYGEGDKEKTKKIIEQTITFKALVAIIASIFLYLFIKPLALFFDSNPLVVKSVISYGYIRIYFVPIMFSSFTVNTALRCIGDAKKPLYLMLVSSIMNVILDPIFIFKSLHIKFLFIDFTLKGFGMGVFGAALATVISITFAFLIGMYILLGGKTHIKIEFKKLFRLDKEIDFKLITIGLPNGADSLTRNLSSFVVLKLIAIYGSVAIAAAGIGMRILGLLFMPLIGLMMGGGTIVGQNIGNNQIDRAEKTAFAAAKLGLLFSLFASSIAFLFSKQIMMIFTNDMSIILIGIPMLKILVISTIFIAVLFGIATLFSGSGYNFPFLVSSVVGRWIVAIPFALITVYFLHLSINWLWFSFVLGDIAESVTIYIFYKKGKWKEKRVV
ncbi:MATE family efflux transporter [Helicovermis profundi]|uniref:Probable multidrug resistance protein NorM n=1 Tax=Helicovermis profundi TaxID=3065157 RepID=A0AAU9E1K9_9FIRM|nr:MATE family efflux transporter [Clostridia bacterium S502]